MSKEFSPAMTSALFSLDKLRLISVCHVLRNIEKPMKVFRRAKSNFLGSKMPDFRQFLRYAHDPGRLVALAAVRDRGKKGGICFNEHPVQRYLCGHIPERLGLRKGNVSGKGNKKTAVHGPFCVLPLSGKAMQNAAKSFGCPLLLDDGQSVVPGIGTVLRWTAVDDDGSSAHGGNFHLLKENFFLCVAWRMIVEIIKTDFATGDDFWLLQQSIKPGKSGRIRKLGLMRVDPSRRKNARGIRASSVGPADFKRTMHRIWPVAYANGEDRAHSRSPGARKHGIAVLVVTWAVEMGVGVYKHLDLC